MSTLHSVSIGGMYVGRSPGVLSSTGIGSCLVVILYDPQAKVGALAHTLLPTALPSQAPLSANHYVDESIDVMMADLLRMGATRERLHAKIIGGANMFPFSNDKDVQKIGAQNIAAARQALHGKGIPLLAEVVGGTVGRNVRFDLETGICSVETKI